MDIDYDYLEDDCEGQALIETDICLIWGCNKVELIKVGRFWVCPNCKSSYGSNPSKSKK